MEARIEHVTPADLDAVVRIEQLGFTPEEAGTREAYRERIQKLASTFLVAKVGGQVVGFVVGPAVNEQYVTDDMYVHTPDNLPTGGNQLVLSIATDPDYRGHGIGSQLLTALAKEAKAAHRHSISLDSLDRNVPFYEHNGYRKVRVSDSSHAHERWYSLVKSL